MWPVEFFLIATRQARNHEIGNTETQVLVRKSSNGTSKYGLGIGVPANQRQTESWSYHKIDIREDAFHNGHNSDDTPTDIFEDPELEKVCMRNSGQLVCNNVEERDKGGAKLMGTHEKLCSPKDSRKSQ